MRLFPIVTAILFVGCSDYDLTKSDDDAGRFDSGEGDDEERDDDDDEDDDEDDDPDLCEPRDIEARDVEQTEECYVEGTTVGSFTPVVEWTKSTFSVDPSSNNVMMMPAVGSLTDDDGDGDADEDDVPDIVFITYGGNGTLRVVSGDGGAEHFSVTGNSIQGQGGVALGDIDGDGWTDIVAAGTNGVVAFDHTGAVMWTSASLSGLIYGTSDNPAIADLDGDGRPEVIMGAAILDGQGRIVGRGGHGMGGVEGNNVGTTSFAADIDGDGVQEVVTGNALYQRDGTAIWYNRADDGYPAVGNFDSDAAGEIVVTTGGQVRLQDDDGTVLCTASIPGAGSAYYGGPPTVADFDGDGEAEFAAAAGSRYSVFERDCSVKWQATTQDASSGNTGSSVFDFEGDGIAEAVYADETRLWVFSGPDGSVKLESTEHSNATWLEYPAVADVDGDDHAEIVVANTPYNSSFYGITVFGDAANSWRSGRKVWNQHAYSITNVNDDGSIPATPAQNWLTYNNFRSGDIGAGTAGYSAPDLVANVEDVCIDECNEDRLYVWVTLANDGFEDIETDVSIRLQGEMSNGDFRLLASDTYTETLVAGRRSAGIEFVVEEIPRGLVDVIAEVDEGNDATRGVVSECIEDNNEDEWDENLCPE